MKERKAQTKWLYLSPNWIHVFKHVRLKEAFVQMQ